MTKSPFLDPNDPRYSDTPNVYTHPLEGRGNVPADPPSPLDARNVGRRVITFDNGRTEDVYAVEVNHESGRWEQIWVKRSSEMADRVADALNASSPAPAGHGPWCVQDGHGDSAEPFVHGPDCRRDDTPAESPAPAGLDVEEVARWLGKSGFVQSWERCLSEAEGLIAYLQERAATRPAGDAGERP